MDFLDYSLGDYMYIRVCESMCLHVSGKNMYNLDSTNSKLTKLFLFTKML